jgi:signal transduction histidine kinase
MLRVFPHLNPFARLQGEEVFSSLYGFLLIAFAMYGRFLRIFLDLDQTYPKFNKSFIIFEKIFVPFGLLIFALGILSMQHYSIKLFSVLYILTLPFFLISVFYLGTRKRTINRIILTGTLLAVVIARSAAIQHYFSGNQNFQLINFQYIIASIVILFLFLNLGLLYKSKLIHLQNIQLEVQKESALSEQRAMISADLHDDLGASLSGIHLNAIMAQKSMHKDLSHSDKSLGRIIEDLKSIIQNMGDIIWAINTDKEDHKSISGQLKDFYFDLMDDYNIQCNYHVDENIESQVTNIIARKNLLLISKECINNVLKHARATRIDFTIATENDLLILAVQDNGVGMADTETNFNGNGLKNMKFRAKKIHGKLTINSEVGVGTSIVCMVPLTNIRYLPHASI